MRASGHFGRRKKARCVKNIDRCHVRVCPVSRTYTRVYDTVTRKTR